MERPKSFHEETDHILLEQHSPVVTQTLWVSKDPVVFCITQRWHNGEGEEATLHLLLHELEELAQAARDHAFPPSDGIQEHEDYLDAQDRHDSAMGRY